MRIALATHSPPSRVCSVSVYSTEPNAALAMSNARLANIGNMQTTRLANLTVNRWIYMRIFWPSGPTISFRDLRRACPFCRRPRATGGMISSLPAVGHSNRILQIINYLGRDWRGSVCVAFGNESEQVTDNHLVGSSIRSMTPGSARCHFRLRYAGQHFG